MKENFNSKKGDLHLVIILFLVLIPFFRFNGIANFKGCLLLVLFSLIFVKNLIFVKSRFFDFKNTRLTGFLLLIFWSLICMPLAPIVQNSIEVIIDFSCYYFFYLMISRNVSTANDINKLDILLCFFLIVELVFVLGQMSRISVFDFYSETQRSDNATIVRNGSRYWGTMNGSNTLASFVAPIGIYLFAKIKLSGKPYIAYTILATTAFVTLQTGTRSGIISLIMAFVWFLFSDKNKRIITVIQVTAIVIVLFAVLGTNFITNSTVFQRSTAANADDRTIIWTTAMQIFYEKPIVGTTVGNLNQYLIDYKVPVPVNKTGVFGHVENVYFTILLSAGLIGLIFYLSQFVVFFKKMHSLSKHREITSEAKIIVKALRVAFISICISMFLEPSFYLNQNSVLLLYLFIGILYSKYVNKKIVVVQTSFV